MTTPWCRIKKIISSQCLGWQYILCRADSFQWSSRLQRHLLKPNTLQFVNLSNRGLFLLMKPIRVHLHVPPLWQRGGAEKEREMDLASGEACVISSVAEHTHDNCTVVSGLRECYAALIVQFTLRFLTGDVDHPWHVSTMYLLNKSLKPNFSEDIFRAS